MAITSDAPAPTAQTDDCEGTGISDGGGFRSRAISDSFILFYADLVKILVVQKILDQGQTPVCTLISLLTTVFVEALIVIFELFTPAYGWGRLGAMLLIGFVALIGFVVNCIAGRMATDRGEYMGGMIALVGIAVWIVTVLGTVAVRDYRAY